jgi:hypothetical protein
LGRFAGRVRRWYTYGTERRPEMADKQQKKEKKQKKKKQENGKKDKKDQSSQGVKLQ